MRFSSSRVGCLSSCNSDSSEQTAQDDTTVWTSYGEPIADLSTPVSASEVSALMDAGGSGQGLFDAEIVQSCMTMGCWMSVKGPQGDTVMVFMKDHAFFVPKTACKENERCSRVKPITTRFLSNFRSISWKMPGLIKRASMLYLSLFLNWRLKPQAFRLPMFQKELQWPGNKIAFRFEL